MSINISKDSMYFSVRTSILYHNIYEDNSLKTHIKNEPKFVKKSDIEANISFVCSILPKDSLELYIHNFEVYW